MKIIFNCFILIIFTSCLERKCENSDKECLHKKVINHQARKYSFYKKFNEAPLTNKVFSAPKELLDFVNLDNRKLDLPHRTKKSKDFDKIAKLTQAALDELPPIVKSKFAHKLIGIFLLEGLGSTGFTDMVKDQNGKTQGAFIILDSGVLAQRDANSWASWKENTPFETGDLKIELKIEEEENNNIKNAIQYILLHELGHVVSINSQIHPPWDRDEKDINIKEYPYTMLSWKKEQEKLIGQLENTNKLYVPYKTLNFYHGKKLSNNQMLVIYTLLNLTNIPTLYGAMNAADDWAESFVTYIHTVLLKKPFDLKIKTGETVIFKHELCYFNNQCKRKTEYLKNYFNSSSQKTGK